MALDDHDRTPDLDHHDEDGGGIGAVRVAVTASSSPASVAAVTTNSILKRESQRQPQQRPRRLRPRPPHNRIVLLFDLDCFYAQCERVRLGLPRSAPICLLQWDACLAVAYPAREFGIKRGDSWDDIAKKSNNTVISIHLPVIPLIVKSKTLTGEALSEVDDNDGDHTDDEEEDNNHSTICHNIADEFDRVYKLTPEQQKHCLETERGVRRSQRDGKACLERYRLASARIFGVVLESLTRTITTGRGTDSNSKSPVSVTSSSSSPTSSFVLEKASIDEFYLDITEYCYDTINGDERSGDSNIDSNDFDPVTTEKKTVLIGQPEGDEEQKHLSAWMRDDFSDDDDSDFIITQRALRRACYIAQQVRSDVWATLGFTMSAGISTNKTMAKLAASYGKPNGQAMLHPNYFCVVLSETKMKKVRNFGGALGNEVLSMLSNLRREEGGKEQSFDELKISVMMNDVRVISLPTLMRFFSQETAEHIFHAAQGIDNEPVKETSKALVKSITAFKSFPAMKNVTDIRNWIVVLANEIAERVTQDAVRNNRYPKTCTLNYSYYATPTATRPSTGSSRSARQSRSVRLNFPSERESIDRKSASLVEQSMHKVEEILKLHFKLCGIGLAAGNFEMRGPPQGMTSIQSFLRKMGEDSQSSSFRQQQGATTRSPLKTSLVGQPLKKKKKTGIATFFSSTESNPLTAGTVRDCESKSLQMKPSCEGPSSVGPISRHDVELSAATSNEDPDLELARRLQAQYDRENYVISRSETNRLWLQNSKKNKKNMAPKIDSFFTKKK